eukprot:gene7724-9187_t
MAAQGAAATTEGGGRAQAALEEALERVQCPESGGDGGRDVEALEEAASAMERVARGHAELLQLLVCARERAELAHAEARTAAKALSPEPYTSHDKKVKELRRQGLAAAYIETELTPMMNDRAISIYFDYMLSCMSTEEYSNDTIWHLMQ